MLKKLSRAADVALVVLAFVIGSLAVLNFMSNRSQAGRSATAELAEIDGKILPRFAVQYLGGQMDTIPSAGLPTVLYFFSTTCAACERNKEAWQALADSLRGVAVAIAISPESLATVAAATQSAPSGYRVGVIAESDLEGQLKAYRMWATPITYVLDEDGKLHLSVVGIFGEGATDRIISAARRIRPEVSR